MTEQQEAAMRMGLEALESCSGVPHWPSFRPVIADLTAALEQPAQEVDWEKLYRLEVKKKEALAAKYERDTGKQLTRIVPMNQPAQQEPVANFDEVWEAIDWDKWRMEPIRELVRMIHDKTRPQAREWVGLTEAEIGALYKAGWSNNIDFARAIEAKLREKNA